MEGEPARHDLQLSAGQRARQQLAVYGDGRLVFAVLHVNVGLVVLSNVVKQHVDDLPPKRLSSGTAAHAPINIASASSYHSLPVFTTQNFSPVTSGFHLLLR